MTVSHPAPEKFHCHMCGACCRIPDGIVRVSEAEIVRIAAFLGMTEADFIDRETELAPDRRGLILRSRPDGACVWLTDNNLCRINPVKPDTKKPDDTKKADDTDPANTGDDTGGGTETDKID